MDKSNIVTRLEQIAKSRKSDQTFEEYAESRIKEAYIKNKDKNTLIEHPIEMKKHTDLIEYSYTHNDYLKKLSDISVVFNSDFKDLIKNSDCDLRNVLHSEISRCKIDYCHESIPIARSRVMGHFKSLSYKQMLKLCEESINNNEHFNALRRTGILRLIDMLDAYIIDKLNIKIEDVLYKSQYYVDLNCSKSNYVANIIFMRYLQAYNDENEIQKSGAEVGIKSALQVMKLEIKSMYESDITPQLKELSLN